MFPLLFRTSFQAKPFCVSPQNIENHELLLMLVNLCCTFLTYRLSQYPTNRKNIVPLYCQLSFLRYLCWLITDSDSECGLAKAAYGLSRWSLPLAVTWLSRRYIIYVFNKTKERVKELTSVVQKLVSVIHWINHYPVDKCQENQLLYPLDSGLLSGQCYPPFDLLGPDGIFMKGKVCIFRRIGFKFF